MFEDGPDALIVDIAFWLPGLTNPETPLAELGRLGTDVCDKLRALGIMQLLTTAKTDPFLHQLMRSGRTWHGVLQRLQDGGRLDDHFRVSGRIRPVLDAIAAGDLQRVRAIQALVPAEFRYGHEYEDDYCYARLLFELVHPTLDASARSVCETLLTRYETWLRGEPSARHALCSSLLARDQDQFDEAFEDLLSAFEAAIAADRARGRREDDCVIAERQMCVEGLALLRLAGLHGLTTADEYRYCPGLARQPMRTAFPAL